MEEIKSKYKVVNVKRNNLIISGGSAAPGVHRVARARARDLCIDLT